MYPINLGKLTYVVGGKLVRGNPHQTIHGATYLGTREIKPGTVLFAPTKYMGKGFTFSILRTRSSSGVITTKTYANSIPKHHPLIIVPHAEMALWRLAYYQRALSKAIFIGITGSSGKTTTKEMLASILMKKYYTYKSYSNSNVAGYTPFHMCRLHQKIQVAVLEMGMSNLGNIAKQCQCAKPNIGIVTNVAEAHCGSLRDSIHNVARAKQELIDGLTPGGLLVLNADDPGSKNLNIARYQGKILRVSTQSPSSFQAKQIEYTKYGMKFVCNQIPFHFNTWGKHNVSNALAAIAVARYLNVSWSAIQQGLAHYQTPNSRLQPVSGTNGHLLINDSYNANPSSMIEGLKVLKKVAQGRTAVAILGDMSELGSYSQIGHQKVGTFLGQQTKPHFLITIGRLATLIASSAIKSGMKPKSVHSFPNQHKAIRFIRRHIPRNAVLYFKASHNMYFGRIVKKLRS
ncbi:UDP-N-acetylmuramoyl-tripeptide--D-alanyl-D-alanine ligase [Hazenella sp. IB182357]|uniref:UDP-N-acetylmuramoyl-tripeptide--D-alanyl-D-alanine ligase n=1 Tax=Polycladospora coralii TaxID=2771432 RepID=A0A926N7N8_9BACL|nr:UDP-N-acetylmuramoyl-tripeptide--D-alanyl-D-alanine ligase [Polycladospora coralii]MBD1371571.1 UDP-N-acetylmuramoyl-tripeptide--D-alanyl-D-alanine ligase [Polycladospora coralii]